MAVSDDDLNAFLDGQLDPAREAEVLAWLDENPQARDRLRDYAEHKLLIRIGARQIEEDEPADAKTSRLARDLERAVARRYPRWFANAAAALLLVAAGWAAHTVYRDTSADRLPDYVVEAAGAHLVLGHMDVAAAGLQDAGSADLAHAFTAQLGKPVRLPSFEAVGLRFVGGKVLGGVGGVGPLASLVYQDGEGHRLTVCLSADEDDAPRELNVAEIGGMTVGWWSDGLRSYAVVAEAPRQDLIAILGGMAAPRLAAGLW